MIITKDMLNQKVSREMFPTRLDSATDLYTYTDKGLVLYNIKPTTWNVLYPFFQQNNKFTMDDFNVENKDITYKELIDTYNDIYTTKYEIEKGFNEEKRKQILVEEFNEIFGVNGTTISKKLDSHYELKYSKSQNVYTLYYLENYIANGVDSIDKLLNQKVYQQEFLSLEEYPISKEINEVKVDDALLSILDNKEKLSILKSNKIGMIK